MSSRRINITIADNHEQDIKHIATQLNMSEARAINYLISEAKRCSPEIQKLIQSNQPISNPTLPPKHRVNIIVDGEASVNLKLKSNECGLTQTQYANKVLAEYVPIVIYEDNHESEIGVALEGVKKQLYDFTQKLLSIVRYSRDQLTDEDVDQIETMLDNILTNQKQIEINVMNYIKDIHKDRTVMNKYIKKLIPKALLCKQKGV